MAQRIAGSKIPSPKTALIQYQNTNQDHIKVCVSKKACFLINYCTEQYKRVAAEIADTCEL